jgi:H+-transporting ATPase
MSDQGPVDGDIERGDQGRTSGRSERRISRASIRENWANLDEYGKLVKYVSTYREGGQPEEDTGEEEMRRPWYAPWRQKRVRVHRVDETAGLFPEEWLITDIREGLATSEVAARRQRAGWNELVSEKENPVAKILSYFRGPILYGKIQWSFPDIQNDS